MQTHTISRNEQHSFSVESACLYIICGIVCVDVLPTLLSIWAVLGVIVVAVLSIIYLIQTAIVQRASYFLSYRDLALAVLMFIIGFAAVHIEIYRQPHQMLETSDRYDFDAVVESAEWRSDNRIRVILTPLKLETISERQNARTTDLTQYGRIRLTIRSDQLPQAGDYVSVSARLFPLSGPYLPDMPDYGRTAFLHQIGASGFAYQFHIHDNMTDMQSFSQFIHQMRYKLDKHFQNRLQPTAASIASSLYLGKRDRLPSDIYTAFQESGLAHLLAISGLHMALFCLSLFGILRLCLLPAERMFLISAHKIAALLAVFAGLAYLLIAGMPISAMRAWAIAALMLLAIMIDRRALTLRTLALIAILMLLWKPSYLYQPAFQLSFSATLGIVMAHQIAKHRLPNRGVLSFISGLAVTSLAAGLITTPFIAYHFALFTPYSLLSNLVAVPLMGLLMPFGLLALSLDAVGLSLGLLTLYEVGIHTLIEVANLFASLPASGMWIKPPKFYLLGVWLFSLIFIVSKLKYVRPVGLAGVCIFFGLWAFSPSIDVIQIQLRDKPVLIVRGERHLVATDEISEFWKSIIASRLGNKPFQQCQKPICSVALNGLNINLIAKRVGITEACKDKEHISLSLYKPKYHCIAQTQFFFLQPEHDSALYNIGQKDGIADLHIKRISQVTRPWRIRN